MQYQQYCLTFPNGIHLGGRSLDESNLTFGADTLFSALFQEALSVGEEEAEWLLQAVRKGEVLFSDAFPYIGETFYLPKPLCRIQAKDKGDSVQKKAWKNLKYIPFEKIDTYLQGNLDAVNENRKLRNIGKTLLKTSAAIFEEKDTEPYQVGVRYFAQDCGLYFILATADGEIGYRVYDLLEGLSYSGIGGKRRSGLGRFEIADQKELDSALFERDAENYLSLSISLPKEEELEMALENANYQVVKRSGFVASETYADTFQKKADLFMLSAGACLRHRYTGDVYDVSIQGRHPVYRYGKPIFLPLEVK